MLRLAALVALGACNDLYGLDPTRLAPQDAAPETFACPAHGEPLAFKRSLVQVSTQDCSSYEPAMRANRVLAACREPVRGIFTGTLDEGAPLVHTPELEPPPDYFTELVHQSADGDFVLVKLCHDTTYACTIERYDASGGSWVRRGPLPIMIYYSTNFSRPSYAPRRQLFVKDGDDNRYELYEEQGDTWMRMQTYTLDELGLNFMLDNGLSPDGLRMIFYGRLVGASKYEMLYIDRLSLDARFGKARTLDLPLLDSSSLSDDCERLYFTALRAVFYYEQE